MGYNKVISYGSVVEVFRYEKYPMGFGKKKATAGNANALSDIPFDGQNADCSEKPIKIRSRESIRRAVLAFRRLVGANLRGTDHPVLASFTYGENMESLRQGRSDFNAFARSAKSEFGDGLRYICVAEFQKRGAVHFHSLIWGLPAGTVKRERSTRMVAGLWGRGFVDLVETDGSIKLSGYLGKYLSKTFKEPRLSGMKAYICSRNVYKPTIDRDALLAPYFTPETGDLSTALAIREAEYTTQWLGRCHYKQYLVKSS